MVFKKIEKEEKKIEKVVPIIEKVRKLNDGEIATEGKTVIGKLNDGDYVAPQTPPVK